MTTPAPAPATLSGPYPPTREQIVAAVRAIAGKVGTAPIPVPSRVTLTYARRPAATAPVVAAALGLTEFNRIATYPLHPDSPTSRWRLAWCWGTLNRPVVLTRIRALAAVIEATQAIPVPLEADLMHALPDTDFPDAAVSTVARTLHVHPISGGGSACLVWHPPTGDGGRAGWWGTYSVHGFRPALQGDGPGRSHDDPCWRRRCPCLRSPR